MQCEEQLNRLGYETVTDKQGLWNIAEPIIREMLRSNGTIPYERFLIEASPQKRRLLESNVFVRYPSNVVAFDSVIMKKHVAATLKERDARVLEKWNAQWSLWKPWTWT